MGGGWSWSLLAGPDRGAGAAGCATNGHVVGGDFEWPADLDYKDLGTYGTLCLDPCEVEFVPEPGTLMLLGSGLAGLAGYATLRWRARV